MDWFQNLPFIKRFVPRFKHQKDHASIFLLTDSHGARCFVEIKNCTLVNDGVACFPDAVTQRGHKHLKELERLSAEGNRCVMFYCIQRMDAECFRPADQIDPAYGEALREAHLKGGVEILVYDVWMDLERIVLNRKIPHWPGYNVSGADLRRKTSCNLVNRRSRVNGWIFRRSLEG